MLLAPYQAYSRNEDLRLMYSIKCMPAALMYKGCYCVPARFEGRCLAIGSIESRSNKPACFGQWLLFRMRNATMAALQVR